MDTDRQVQALESKVSRLEMLLNSVASQLRQQLLGNNPSTNYRKLLQSGGTQGGWFGLTNNGVTININGATNPFTGLANGLSVLDIATGYQATVDPFHFAIISPTNNPVGYLGGGIVGPQAFVNLFVGNTTDASGVLLLGASGVGTFTDGVATTTIAPTGIITDSITLTTPLDVPSGGTGSSTLTAGGVLIGDGVSPVAFANPAVAGGVLTSNGAGVAPSFQALPAGAVTSVQGRTGAVTLVPADDASLVAAGTPPGTVTLLKLTGGGANGSITIGVTGRITAWVNPT